MKGSKQNLICTTLHTHLNGGIYNEAKPSLYNIHPLEKHRDKHKILFIKNWFITKEYLLRKPAYTPLWNTEKVALKTH